MKKKMKQKTIMLTILVLCLVCIVPPLQVEAQPQRLAAEESNSLSLFFKSSLLVIIYCGRQTFNYSKASNPVFYLFLFLKESVIDDQIEPILRQAYLLNAIFPFIPQSQKNNCIIYDLCAQGKYYQKLVYNYKKKAGTSMLILAIQPGLPPLVVTGPYPTTLSYATARTLMVYATSSRCTFTYILLKDLCLKPVIMAHEIHFSIILTSQPFNFQIFCNIITYEYIDLKT